MWLDRKVYESLLLDNAKLREESRVLNNANHAQQTTIDWFRVRITQLERERAQLLFNYTGVKVEVPEITKAPQSVEEILGGSVSFADLGDAEAKKQGVDWDAAGLMEIRKQAQRS